MYEVTLFNGVSTQTLKKSLSLSEVFEIIKNDENLKVSTDKLRATVDDNKRAELKKQLPSVTFAGIFNGRNDSDLESLSGVMCFDFDHLPKERLTEIKSKIFNTDIPVIGCFISPSGNGLKVITRGTDNAEKYREFYKLIALYFSKFFNIPTSETEKDPDATKIDLSCINPARLCFLCNDSEAILKDDYESVKPITNVAPLYSNGLEEFDNAMFELSHAGNPIPTPFDNLNRELGGGFLPALYAIGGAPAIGKTAFIFQIARDLLTKHVPVLFYSLELNSKSVAARFSTIESALYARENQLFGFNEYGKNRYKSIPVRKILGQKFNNEEEFYLFNRAFQTSRIYAPYMQLYTGKLEEKHLHLPENIELYRKLRESYNLRVDDPLYLELEVLELSVRDFVAINKASGITPVMFVDYLQKIDAPGGTDKERADMIIRALKRLSKELDFPIIALSLVSRPYERPITKESFKESGGIEFECDAALGFQYSAIAHSEPNEFGRTQKFNMDLLATEYPRHVTLNFVKHRDGEEGVKLDFDYYPDQGLFFPFERTEKVPNADNVTHKFHSYTDGTKSDVEINDLKLFGDYEEEQTPTTENNESNIKESEIIAKIKEYCEANNVDYNDQLAHSFIKAQNSKNWQYIKNGETVNVLDNPGFAYKGFVNNCKNKNKK